nr:MAG TPA: hypothetical protein [Caudoviricetes sp.]
MRRTCLNHLNRLKSRKMRKGLHLVLHLVLQKTGCKNETCQFGVTFGVTKYIDFLYD